VPSPLAPIEPPSSLIMVVHIGFRNLPLMLLLDWRPPFWPRAGGCRPSHVSRSRGLSVCWELSATNRRSVTGNRLGLTLARWRLLTLAPHLLHLLCGADLLAPSLLLDGHLLFLFDLLLALITGRCVDLEGLQHFLDGYFFGWMKGTGREFEPGHRSWRTIWGAYGRNDLNW